MDFLCKKAFFCFAVLPSMQAIYKAHIQRYCFQRDCAVWEPWVTEKRNAANIPIIKQPTCSSLKSFLQPLTTTPRLYARYMHIFNNSIKKRMPARTPQSPILKKGPEPVPIGALQLVTNYQKTMQHLKTDTAKLQHIQENPLLLTHYIINRPINDLGETALHLAAAAAEKDLVQKLLACKANVHAQDVCKNTPLHALATCDDQSKENIVRNIAQTLLQHGARPETENTDGKKVINVAKKHSNDAIINLLEPSHTIQDKPERKREE